jgi:NAD(P)-dependent dehydrogenase (short-subunit alcohol dehydrogenase family)
MELFDLHGETAAVIGATGVLGGAIAQGLAQAGARVAVLGRNRQRGEQRVESIRQIGGEAEFITCDATDEESLRQAHAQTQQMGEVSILVNAAGGNQPQVTVNAQRAFGDIALEDWRNCLDLNLAAGAFLPCRQFGPAMAAKGRGSIINIASVAAHIPPSGVVAYAAAKAAVLSLTRFLAREWATQGVRVNSITPGFFPAEQNRRLLFNEDGSPTPRAQQILGHTPMDRFGKPDELVGAAVFLAASRASGFMTGTDIVVDGGFLAQTI